MKKKKIVISILAFIVILSITFFVVFKNTSLTIILNNIKKINSIYVIICLLLIFLYFLFQGIYNKITLKSLNTNISLSKGIFYSMVEFFFSGVTPSSTGGQPIELYYMTKDKIPMRKSLIVLILDTIFFKLFLVVSSLLIILFRLKFIFNNGKLFSLLFFLGVLVDVAMIVGCYFLIFKQKIVKKILVFYYKLIFKITKKDNNEKIDEILENYKRETVYIKNHKKEVFLGVVITFIQRIFLFSIAYVIYRAFGLHKYNFIDLLVIQISVQMCIECLPFPGGTGASEYIYKRVFLSIFGLKRAVATMILIRSFTFYIPLILCTIVIILVTKFHYMKKESK